MMVVIIIVTISNVYVVVSYVIGEGRREQEAKGALLKIRLCR